MLLSIYLSDSQNIHICSLSDLNVNKDHFALFLCAFSPALPSISSSSFLMLVVAAVSASVDVAVVVVFLASVAVPLLFFLLLKLKMLYHFSKAYCV